MSGSVHARRCAWRTIAASSACGARGGTASSLHLSTARSASASNGEPGRTIGTTDELGYDVVDDPVHLHDVHATMLHLLGVDHERLTYRFQGRDYRLTDVFGKVVGQLL